MTAFDKAFDEVNKLVLTFSSNLAHYMSSSYDEATARKDFIDKFFIALGWDVNHETQTNPYEQEVKIERSQKQQNDSARKRADYAFYLAPNHKDEVFFVEAKKPSVLITRNEQHYFQTIRYGWNAGCPISVLTDFEEFVIVDCRATPNIKYALNGQHKTYKYTDYTHKEKFAEIYWLFSREAVANKSIEKYAASLGKAKGKATQKALFKGGYQTIDDSFLEYIDGIRLNLAQAFKKNDDSLDGEQLTEAVQRTVDRLVFIRFLEDKFIEAEQHVNEWGSSPSLGGVRGGCWNDFIADCRKLDAKYNGVVFKKHFIDEQDFAGAEEKMFVDICQDMSSLNSPYDFNYIPIHILGSIYERFLGKVIRTTAKRVVVEEKPEVRKAGGVYYTPKYIVDYIVQNTVGKQIAGKTPKQISELHFADIACGSGSFLIGVYDCLLDYHKKYYLDKYANKTYKVSENLIGLEKKELDKRSEDYGNIEYINNQWTLTLKLKQDILLNNIYGVDIDYQAVEVTQLSLFLKMLEDESLSSIATRQGRLFAKVLPDLSKNIMWGNSLISNDIMFSNGSMFEDELYKKVLPFDFKNSFIKVMRSGGFDAIVGNPPYVTIGGKEDMMTGKKEMKYYQKNYISSNYKPNLYSFFYERGIKYLKENGLISFIVPRTLLDNKYYKTIREFFVKSIVIELILKIDYEVFENATTGGTCICVLNKSKNDNNTVLAKEVKNEDEFFIKNSIKIKQKELMFGDFKIFSIKNNNDLKLLNKIIKNSNKLDVYCSVNNGVNTGNAAKILLSNKNIGSKYRKILEGKDINRYLVNWGGLWINYDTDIKKKINVKDLDTRQSKIDLALRDERIFNSQKIIVRQTADKIIACIDENKFVSRHSTHCILNDGKEINLYYLLGILNSSLIKYCYRKFIPEQGKAFAEVKAINVKQLPIVNINLKISQQKQQHDEIVNCVTQLLAAKQKQTQMKESNDKEFITNQCNALDTQIDNLVYELYGLTNDEIKIVEEG